MSKHRRRRHERRRRHARPSRVVAGTGLSVGVALGMTASAQAADFNVNSLTDSGDGTCDAASGGCTLRDALDDANNNNAPTVDHILFDSSITGSPGTITLNGTQLPTIDEPLYIYGPDAATLTIDGDSLSRILHIGTLTGGDVTVSGLTLTGGSSTDPGGAIFSGDTDLAIHDSVITGNETTSGFAGGGGVYSE